MGKEMKLKEVKIGVVGCGKIGKAIYHLLVDGGICDDVMVADIAPPPNDIPNRRYVQTNGTFADFVRERTLVINALPHTKNRELWSDCVANGVAYFDMSEDEDIDTDLGMAHGHSHIDIPFTMPHCGLAPGMSTVIASSLMRRVDSHPRAVENIKIRVGALSSHATNKLKYHTSWSGDGLVNEYRGNCQVIRKGQLDQETALDGYERLVLDGKEYEAFNTSGGLGTFAYTLNEIYPKLDADYKTLRHVGHHDYVDFLFNDLGLPEHKLIDIFKNHVPSTQNDSVVIYIKVDDHEYYKKFGPTVIGGRRYTAIESTTAVGLISMVELYLDGKIGITPDGGYFKQEDVKFEDVLNTTYGELYYNGIS